MLSSDMGIVLLNLAAMTKSVIMAGTFKRNVMTSHTELGTGFDTCLPKWPRDFFRLLVWACLVLTYNYAAAAPDISTLPNGQLSLSPYLETLEDASGVLNIDSVRRPEVSRAFQGGHEANLALNIGYTNSPWWVQVTLHNSSANTVDRMLEIANSRLTSVHFYAPNAPISEPSILTGSLEPFASRPYANRFFVFPIKLAPHSETTLYLRLESSSAMSIPATLWTPQAFHAHERADYAFQGFYIGMASVMALFFLMMFFALQETLYLKYVGLVFSITFTLMSHNGLVKEFIALDSPAWSLASASIGVYISLALLILFMRHLLATSSVFPRLDRVLRLITGLCVVPFPLALAMSHHNAVYILQNFALITIFVLFGVGVALCLRGLRSAYFFIAAYFSLFVVMVINSLSALHILPSLWDIGSSVQFAVIVEMLIFAAALADRTRQLQAEKDLANESASALQIQLFNTLRASEKSLEQLVNKRVHELRQLIDMLSHEIKNSMSVLRMFIGLEKPSPQNRVFAQQAVKDIDVIIERCLQADQIEHGKINLRRQQFQISQLVSELCEGSSDPTRMMASVTQHNQAATDPQLLKLVLSNLIDNALKYSEPQTTVRITVSPKNFGETAGSVFRILNFTGPAGMPDPDKVFEKFYRSAGAHGKSGSGLGLYLVKSITELLGGTIRYCPAENQVLFELWIPH
jgi:signal transduction histidine kinase